MVIGVLATMMIISSTEAITTAQATRIIANLPHIRKAVIAWYLDNRYKIMYSTERSDGKANDDVKFFFNGVRYNSIQDALSGKAHYSQTYSGVNKSQVVTFTNYLEGLSAVNEKGDIRENVWDYLSSGGYGVNDAGTKWRRETWFAGYQFKDGEEALKKKLWRKKDSLGLIFTAGVRPNSHDAKPITDESQLVTVKSVWLRIMGDAECNGKER